ncbi:flavin reductase family protein [Streptomyces flavofungini]|uniref:flavin reductase family protein n=1 Tax=Streptomyces flavofungini TaxID=68200 RepID=UPI0025B03CF9|nr:flavin reductase family protein [Streptomyces flavofungini]WJV48044.1 flavin reductase family protein [Streptomyces flavofungini]
MMGHAGMAATVVRYLRSVGAPTAVAQPVEALPRPHLRAVREDERAPVDAAEFRRVLGHFATGVTVITAPATPSTTPSATPSTVATAPSPAGATEAPSTTPPPAPPQGTAPPQGPVGFACQSFASLSLDPPLVSFMVARTSTTWPRIARAGVFCVNILGADQGALCRAFAVSGADKFAGVDYDAAPVTGSPRLAGAPAWVDCVAHAVHTGGDHLIVVGRVEALGTVENQVDGDVEGDVDGAAAPLLFHRGAFGEFTPHSGT